ncbi:hypothetical protein PAECIP111892_01791 [Paenibacillus auburnensis]|uniref:HTH cro/C1-type domain-containing protein n=1 Tax=Paenibacillus auburnensis TaxID=2905649 RepID=A0ABM9BU06_9BACL|nr:helix-turn-helix transcriptional regulator [Paenibacillus auburnensis]CAH1194663.1 hypothetical protein PAECIP111892_01791 [Paenibacillus auburnensis]
MAFNFKLINLLEDNDISKNALAREAKVRPNLIYEMCDNKTKRIELETLEKVLITLSGMIGRHVDVHEVIEYKYGE